ncbi:hypothetical protein LIER_40935 [Lithospermum erythrorhizon]|uniref:Gag-pol polyprotein n=1 Tax=Lithospermum erythrorhizon TaxID=34254 RepID=A0AAV3R1X5_LITER
MTGDQNRARVCYEASVPPINPGAPNQESRRKRRGDSKVNTMTNKEDDNSPKKKESLKKAVPHEEVECIPFSEKDQEKIFRVGTKLDKRHTSQLIELIREFADVFAWGTVDMPGMDPAMALHPLHVDPLFPPLKQRKRTFSEKKNVAIREEVANLLKTGAIRELRFPYWIANVVLVKKTNIKWRMCTDFTNLNKACPKDFYPLPY